MNVLIRDQDLSDEHLLFTHQICADRYAAVATNDRRQEIARTYPAGYCRALLAALKA
ncbi:MAG: hypothetical protein IT369_07190 [Candidatus Latescibacteria bacterium]|nr:hypothetical protein [Candidatus Latescibacterota bacterium]